MKADKEVKEKKVIYKGVVVGSKLIVGTKKPKEYAVGDTFSTDNQSVYQGLINNKKIK